MSEPDTHKPADGSLVMNRRSFIKASAIGVGTLTGATQIQGCATTRLKAPRQTGFEYLRKKDIAILTGLTPAIIPAEFSGTPEENQRKLDRFIPQLDEFLVHSSNFTQVETYKFFDNIYFAPTRVLLTGMWSSWEKATPQQINTFLLGWRDSSFNLFRTGYAQLTQLVSVVWYSQPENWPSAQYPGPPKHVIS